MAEGKPIDAKLFLEGREIPFSGVTITNTVNQASIAYIDMVPVIDAKNIKARTMVHVFVRDYTNSSEGFPYVLAWEGEVFGFGYNRQSNSRNFTLKCIDYTSYWDNVISYFLNSMQSLGKGGATVAPQALDFNTAQKSGVQTKSVSHSVESYFIEVMKKSLNEGGDTLNAVTAVINDVTKINAFYNQSQNRLRINDRIFLRSSQALENLLRQGDALNWFQGIIGTSTGFSSLRSTVKSLLDVIFHDMITVPFPSRTENPNLQGAQLTNPANKKFGINSFIFKPSLYMIPPPMCNIFFPDEYSMVNYDRSFFQEPTRLIYKPTLPSVGGGRGTSLSHVYQPPSFAHFMENTNSIGDPGKFAGAGDFEISPTLDSEGNPIPYTADPAFFQDADEQESSATNQGRKREGQFLTNEERMKGIWMAQEMQLPSSTAFRRALGDDISDFTKKVSNYLFFKKRFESRALQITSHLKLSVVPGMNVLLLDDSDEEMNMIAYCSSVTHRINVGQGGYTQVTLSYGRTVEEQQQASTTGGSPPVPPWYSAEIFGSVSEDAESECAPQKVKDLGQTYTGSPLLNDFYKDLIGELGSKAVTSYYKSENTLVGAVCRLLQEYKSVKDDTSQPVLDFISGITRRDYVIMKDAFEFIGAKTPTPDVENAASLINFSGDNINGVNRPDGNQIKQRQDVVKAIQRKLNDNRGFRG
jgi:hypothetical protein